jgi:phage gpG-like protein
MTSAGTEIIVVEDNGKLFAELMTTAINKALEEIGIVAEGYAIGYETAVDTGRLRNSITHQVINDEKAVIIGTNVEYAPYIELGTSKFTGIQFLYKAAHNHLDEYREMIEDALKEA